MSRRARTMPATNCERQFENAARYAWGDPFGWINPEKRVEGVTYDCGQDVPSPPVFLDPDEFQEGRRVRIRRRGKRARRG